MADRSNTKQAVSIMKFLVGIVIMVSILVVSSAGLIPADGAGGVIGHNMGNKIDATPLFYTDSEDIPRLEEGVMDCLKAKESK